VAHFAIQPSPIESGRHVSGAGFHPDFSINASNFVRCGGGGQEFADDLKWGRKQLPNQILHIYTYATRETMFI
jgi:hypothetical protein